MSEREYTVPREVTEEFRNRLAEAIAASANDRAYIKGADDAEATFDYNVLADDVITFFIGRGWQP